MPEVVQSFMSSFISGVAKLGTKRLIALGLVGITLFATILFSSMYLAKPSSEALYIGLSRGDVNRIGLALGEAGINFDVSSDGSSVRVPIGLAAKARMMLAQKGLPTSNNAGYELFDNMGSLGLTSFMQQITRQRALEGEIARTIQAVQGVRAARVHIVLPDKGSFRKEDQKPSASVVIRTDAAFLEESAQSIRHLVAAAVPSLSTNEVTIMDTNGRLLASGADSLNGSPIVMSSLQKRVAASLENNIRRQLSPIVGANHFQTSVNVTLNTDQRQINETIYDPDSKVERSVHVVKDLSDNTNARSTSAVSVEQNIPQEETGANPGDKSTEKHNRSEETDNYEINRKIISTVSNGYSVQKVDVAVVIDKAVLMRSFGAEKKDAAVQTKQFNERLAEIKNMVAAAVGIDSKRGDLVNVSAIDFIGNDDTNMRPVAVPLLDSIMPYASSLVSGVVLIIAVLLVLFLGVRPLMRDFKSDGKKLVSGDGMIDNIPALQALQAAQEARFEQEKLAELSRKMRVPPEHRLEKLIDMDEERFASVLKDWVRGEAGNQEPLKAS
ncbi:MAG: flagellar basal-body MS-ring/collar protein FliF [Alphaproteobacteria bacterium]|nr:flagellar basal-body MS-ring/collar protein FliF [Alphaproteobacteria bacterium]